MSAITVGEDLVHYEVLGRGRPVILLHSWIGSWRYWIPIMRQMQMKYRGYSIDLFGFGDSSKNREQYALPRQVELLNDFVKQMGIPKIAFIAHGLGAYVALEFARQFPDCVARMLVTGAPLFDPGDLETRIPAGHRVLLTASGDSRNLAPVDGAVFSADAQRSPNTPVAEILSPGGALNQNVFHQAEFDRGAVAIRNGEAAIAPPANSAAANNPLRAVLQDSMESLLARCFKRSDAEYDRFQADIAKADNAALLESAKDFEAGELLDTVRLLKLPIVIAHGADDPIIPSPGDAVWNYLTTGNEDTLLPVPLPDTGHFPMIDHEPFQRLVGLFLDIDDVSKIEVKHRWRRRSR